MRHIRAIAIALAACLLSGCYYDRGPNIIFYELPPESTTSEAPNNTFDPEPLPPQPRTRHISGYESYIIQNPETVGELEIAGLKVPVVQAGDNEKYLHLRFDGTEKEYSETVFADYRCDMISPDPPNLILYSHNLQSGDGFAKLAKYYPWTDSRKGSLDYYLENPILYYADLYDPDNAPKPYAVFAAAYVTMDRDDPDYIDFTDYIDIGSKADFADFAAGVLDRAAFYNPDISLRYGDRFVMLSTCLGVLGKAYDTRLIVFAREVRPDEAIDPEKAVIQDDPLYFEAYYSIMGGSWPGREWDPETIDYS